MLQHFTLHSITRATSCAQNTRIIHANSEKQQENDVDEEFERIDCGVGGELEDIATDNRI